MSKLGNNKREVRIVLCYFIGIIISGIVIAVWSGIVIHWLAGLFFLGCWYFAFIIMPFGMDMAGREDAQKDAQYRDKRRNQYKKKRGWE